VNRLGAFVHENGFPIGVFLFLRVWTMVWASVTAAFVPLAAEAPKFYYGVEPLRDWLIAPWQRWDTIWYTKIALEGYAADLRAVFSPLYPLLIHLVTLLSDGNAVAAALFIASAAALASYILLYQLAREFFDEPRARRALLFLAAFPTAFFLFAAYSESLFLACALGAFLCARHKRWLWAGVLGACAAMTRPQGILFVLPLTVEFFSQYRVREISGKQAWTLLLVAGGGIVHLVWLTLQFETPLVWLQAQNVWHRAVLPWNALGEAWRAVFTAASPLEALVSFMDPFFALVFLGALVWSWRNLPPSMTVYMATIVIPPLFVLTTYAERYPLTAMARYVLVAFPFFLLCGALPKRGWQTPLLGVSFVLQSFWLILFVAWVFVH